MIDLGLIPTDDNVAYASRRLTVLLFGLIMCSRINLRLIKKKKKRLRWPTTLIDLDCMMTDIKIEKTLI